MPVRHQLSFNPLNLRAQRIPEEWRRYWRENFQEGHSRLTDVSKLASELADKLPEL
jgi:hypothetical protein